MKICLPGTSSSPIGVFSPRFREARVNTRLRRADWRFLLPNPCPRRAVCLTGGRLGEAVSAIAGQVLTERQRADLAVVRDPNRATLSEAWGSLEGGGWCYSEWYWRSVGGPKAIRRRLEKAGFEQVAAYWPWPAPRLAAPMVWLPLDHPHAVRHFLNSLPTSRGRLGTMRRRLRLAVWRLGLRCGLLLPVCVRARKPSSTALPGGATRPDPAGEEPRDQWLGWRSGRSQFNLPMVLLTGGPGPVSKAVRLVFAAGDSRPGLAIKTARLAESSLGLRREADVLRALERFQASGITGVPRIEFTEEQGGLVTVGETALSGSPMLAALTPDSYRSLAQRGVRWLASLASCPREQRAMSCQNRLIDNVLETFAECFGAVADSASLSHTRRILASLPPLPTVVEHRDFSPWNVNVGQAGDLNVFDWESAELNGLPFLDAIYFLTYLAFFRAPGSRPESYCRTYRDTLDPSTPVGLVTQRSLSWYGAELGLEPACIPALRLLTWLLHTKSEYKRVVADRGGRPGTEMLRRSLFLRLWQADLAQQRGQA